MRMRCFTICFFHQFVHLRLTRGGGGDPVCCLLFFLSSSLYRYGGSGFRFERYCYTTRSSLLFSRLPFSLPLYQTHGEWRNSTGEVRAREEGRRKSCRPHACAAPGGSWSSHCRAYFLRGRFRRRRDGGVRREHRLHRVIYPPRLFSFLYSLKRSSRRRVPKGLEGERKPNRGRETHRDGLITKFCLGKTVGRPFISSN